MGVVVPETAFKLSGVEQRALQRFADSGRTSTRWVCPTRPADDPGRHACDCGPGRHVLQGKTARGDLGVAAERAASSQWELHRAGAAARPPPLRLATHPTDVRHYLRRRTRRISPATKNTSMGLSPMAATMNHDCVDPVGKLSIAWCPLAAAERVSQHGEYSVNDASGPMCSHCANRSYLEVHGFGLERFVAHPLDLVDGFATAPERPGHGPSSIGEDWTQSE